LTLSLIEHGATEVNPVMAFFLDQGPLVFTSVKYLLTSLGVVIFLLVNHNVLPGARFRMSNLFTFAIASFGIVVVWEIMLIYMIARSLTPPTAYVYRKDATCTVMKNFAGVAILTTSAGLGTMIFQHRMVKGEHDAFSWFSC
jgi:hypothetical protein